MASKELLAKIRRQRQGTVDLGDGKEVTFLRPPESDRSVIAPRADDPTKLTFLITFDHVKKYVVDWKGFSEATFFGEAIGSSDPIPFDADLWAEVVSDNLEWNGKIAQAILDSIIKHLKLQGEQEKNSVPAST